ncbi:MAG: VWA domain-containing protein [Campylobacterales bacterium]|nr:VWA domain-containing protein [Campylobacterales bacterium]
MILLQPIFLWLLIPITILYLKRSKKFKETLHILILLLITLALSRPVISQAPKESDIIARDIIIAVDVSYSMRAQDITPDRYTFTKKTIKALLDSDTTDNIMLWAFTTNPLLLSPPTTDHTLIAMALDNLNPEYILTHGTSMRHLFEKLSTMQLQDKHLVLITDGGEEDGIQTLSDLIGKCGVNLTILAMGTPQGSPIMDTDGKAIKDKEGNLVISRINPLLEQLASVLPNASYLLPSSTPSKTADALLESIDTKEGHKITKTTLSYLELYQIPLMLAAILFLMMHTKAMRWLILVMTFFGVQAEASIWDAYRLQNAYHAYDSHDYNATIKTLREIDTSSLQSQMLLGAAYYKSGYYEKAVGIYLGIRSTSSMIKQQLFYNIANCYAKRKQYDKARAYYAKALQLGNDEDARYNLNLIALLEDKASQTLKTMPPSTGQNAVSEPNSGTQEDKNEQDEGQSASGSGGGSEGKQKKKSDKKILTQSKTTQTNPLSSKVYELINKGYIDEKQPW